MIRTLLNLCRISTSEAFHLKIKIKTLHTPHLDKTHMSETLKITYKSGTSGSCLASYGADIKKTTLQRPAQTKKFERHPSHS
jgi:hypothetical protein